LKKINRDNLPHLVDCVIRNVRRGCTTRSAYLLARWWGIDIGRGCRFDGVPVLRRHPGSSCTIGDDCSFLSLARSSQGGIARPCVLWTVAAGASIKLGRQCGLSGTVVSSSQCITLGDRVRCGTNSRIADSDMHPDDPRSGGTAPVIIEDDVWLGAGVLVLKGVRIGRCTLVGAQSVVTKDLPECVIAAGAPAKPLRDLTRDQIERLELRALADVGR
jgi:acetyltransferase-like isoleucine patch superfamily enzyme